jgi:hypothetical protein
MHSEEFLAAIDETVAEHRADLDFLRQLQPDERVTCRICGGSADPQCGCDGEQKVSDAIDFIEGELEILLYK